VTPLLAKLLAEWNLSRWPEMFGLLCALLFLVPRAVAAHHLQAAERL